MNIRTNFSKGFMVFKESISVLLQNQYLIWTSIGASLISSIISTALVLRFTTASSYAAYFKTPHFSFLQGFETAFSFVVFFYILKITSDFCISYFNNQPRKSIITFPGLKELSTYIVAFLVLFLLGIVSTIPIGMILGFTLGKIFGIIAPITTPSAAVIGIPVLSAVVGIIIIFSFLMPYVFLAGILTTESKTFIGPIAGLKTYFKVIKGQKVAVVYAAFLTFLASALLGSPAILAMYLSMPFFLQNALTIVFGSFKHIFSILLCIISAKFYFNK